MPNEEESFEGLSYIIAAADRIVLDAYSFDIDINGVVYLFFLLSEVLRLPIVVDELSILLSFFIKGLFGIINQHILE